MLTEQPLGTSLLCLVNADDKRPNVGTGGLVVRVVRAVTERELARLPAAAHWGLGTSAHFVDLLHLHRLVCIERSASGRFLSSGHAASVRACARDARARQDSQTSEESHCSDARRLWTEKQVDQLARQ